MLGDRNLKLNSAQALTSGTINSTDYVDVLANADVAAGNYIEFVTTINEAFAGGTNVVFEVHGSTDAFGSSDVLLVRTAAIATAALWLGRDPIVLVLPNMGKTTGYRQYRMTYVITGTYTTGKVTTYVGSIGDASGKTYPSGYVYSS